MKSGYYWDWRGVGGVGGVQSWSWLPSARSDDEWRLITKCNFDDTRESDLNISNHVTLTPPAFISSCASVILVCERLCGLCVCECVCQFNFLFQHVIICGMEKGARKARVLSLFPFKPNQPHEIQSEDANVKKRSNIFPSWFCCSNWCFFLTLQDSTRPAFLLRW